MNAFFPPRARPWLALLGGILAATIAAAAEDAPKSPDKQSADKQPLEERQLDKRLLGDLDDDLLRGLPAAEPKKSPAEGRDAKLQEDLGGSDADAAAAEDPLQQIGQRMRAAQQRIGQRDLSPETRELQREIVADLAKLIERARQQQGDGKKSAGQGRGSAQGGAEGGHPTPSPATESTNRVEKGTAEAVETANLRDVLRRHWGHLPEKLREELQNSLSEQFLPQYEKLIEAYYRRLAEERRDRQ
jgi:hypothetical protein